MVGVGGNRVAVARVEAARVVAGAAAMVGVAEQGVGAVARRQRHRGSITHSPLRRRLH